MRSGCDRILTNSRSISISKSLRRDGGSGGAGRYHYSPQFKTSPQKIFRSQIPTIGRQFVPRKTLEGKPRCGVSALHAIRFTN